MDLGSGRGDHHLAGFHEGQVGQAVSHAEDRRFRVEALHQVANRGTLGDHGGSYRQVVAVAVDRECPGAVITLLGRPAHGPLYAVEFPLARVGLDADVDVLTELRDGPVTKLTPAIQFARDHPEEQESVRVGPRQVADARGPLGVRGPVWPQDDRPVGGDPEVKEGQGATPQCPGGPRGHRDQPGRVREPGHHGRLRGRHIAVMTVCGHGREAIGVRLFRHLAGRLEKRVVQVGKNDRGHEISPCSECMGETCP
ncbi:MAG: hypothetical protein CMO01_00815 [Thalassobius sp.]|nr:hypothetical protein [Thalassovita sp.]